MEDPHHCKHLVITCIDFRFQEAINKYCLNLTDEKYDRISIAGAIKDQDYLLRQISISHKLHHISKVHILIHKDCGAYSDQGEVVQLQDLTNVKEKIRSIYPDLEIFSSMINIDGMISNI